MLSLGAPVLAFLLTAICLSAMLRNGSAAGLAMDHPNQRSLHSAPVPRVGGLVLVPAALLTWLFLPSPPLLNEAAVLAAALCVLSYIDDRVGLPVWLRLGSHLVAAAVLLVLLAVPVEMTLPLLLLIAWATNLYNFMDGANGLAGGMAAIGFGAYALGSMAEAPWLALASACVAGAAGGFLLFNFHPARIFMGDAGSIPIGFLAATFGILGWTMKLWPAWFPLLVFSPFVVDASVTLLRRMLRGEKIWEAHRDHYYQRLVRMGWSHRRLALYEYGLMLCAVSTALALHTAQSELLWIGLLAWCALLILLMLTIDCLWSRREHAT